MSCGRSMMFDKYVGVVVIISTLFFTIKSPRIIGLLISSSLAITAVRPFVRGTNSSRIDTSNVIAAIERETEPLSTYPKVSAFFGSEFTKFARFTCSIITPFGFPVEPEV